MNKQWSIIEWRGCYPSNWKGVVVAEAMAHPAKFSSRLIRRIYDHMLEEGWVRAGDAVVDPFGGVALGALEAMRHGLHWTGIELEERFHRIGNANIEKWTREYGTMLKGSARLLHGDSRFMLKLMAGASADGGPLTVDGVVSRPPYAESIKTSEKGSGIDYSKAKSGGKGRTAGRESIATGYGEAPGQLGAMKANESSYQISVSSPPFAQQNTGGGIAAAWRGEGEYEITVGTGGKHQGYQGQGQGQGQLANMRSDNFDLAISSPPFLQSEGGTPEPKAGGVIDAAMYERHAAGNKKAHGYGHTEGQLGGADDFWLSARAIVEQVYESLAPGGHACWVVKDYVKAKQIVPFADQWRQLCEAVGFETLHEHRAMLVHHKGRQGMLEGGVKEIKTESKSFFRRLAEKKGSPRIDWEVVWCMQKP